MTAEEYYSPVRHEIAPITDPYLERWFMSFLDKWAAYIEFDMGTHRLRAYAIPAGRDEEFRFWLGVALYSSAEDEN